MKGTSYVSCDRSNKRWTGGQLPSISGRAAAPSGDHGADGDGGASAGADIVAIDATGRPRPDGRTYADTIRALHDEGIVVMADCGSFADAERAVEAGSDIISTTLSGYTGERKKTDGPDFDLLRRMVAAFGDATPVLCEGRIHTPDQLTQVMAMGAWAAVVGTAITHPTSITRWFAARM